MCKCVTLPLAYGGKNTVSVSANLTTDKIIAFSLQRLFHEYLTESNDVSKNNRTLSLLRVSLDGVWRSNKPDSIFVCPLVSVTLISRTRHRSPVTFALDGWLQALEVCQSEDLPDYGSTAKELHNKLIGALWLAPHYPSLIAERKTWLMFQNGFMDQRTLVLTVYSPSSWVKLAYNELVISFII